MEAASQNNSANAASPASFAVRGGRRRSGRLPLAQLLFAVAGIVLLVTGGAYFLRFVSATAFHKERAFRVLDEFGSQLDNLQRTLANQLGLLPTELVSGQCVLEFSGQAPLSRSCGDRRDSYQRRLALQGPKVGIASVDKRLFAGACGQTNRYGTSLQAREPGVPFTTFSCAIELPSRTEGQVLTAAFTGSLSETVEAFASQEFFDEVLVALGDGTVVATVSRRVEAASPALPLQTVKMRRLGVTNVTALLRSADASTDKTSDGKSGALPAQPVVLTTEIAGDNYRAFVRAVQPRIGIYQGQDDGKAALREERLYLVGLQREDLRAELASSMEPGGRFLVTILTLLAFLVWPLANLRSKSPDDAIAWSEAVACLAAVVMIPAVLAIAAVWVWSYQSLLSWVDAATSRYAQQIDTTLRGELQEGRVLLDQYRSLYLPSRPSGPLAIPIRVRDDGGFVTGQLGTCNKQQDRTCTIDVAKERSSDWRGWTIFSSVFATNSRGIREGDRYTVYDPPMVRSDASYDNREYFRSLQRNEGWVFTDPASGKQDSFVAQRIFSGSDGARVLQIAVPRSEAPECAGRFCGLVTGSASFHSLTASVSPPLLSFAVIDRTNGLVLFHSNDERSLAENFFIETERNPQLLALTEVGQSGFFSGHYVGAGHRFYHWPVQGTPWSVVAFYSLKEVGDLSWHAVFTALAAYTGALLVLFGASALLVWLWAKRNHESALHVAAGFWMLGGRGCSYARWGVALFGAALCLITIYEIWAEGPVSLITQIMWVLLAVAIGAVLLQHRFGVHSVCIAIWLLLISALPAGWMALGYHDVQVQGLLRDGLLGAAHDIQQRRAAIAGDLHRWLSSSEGRANDFPPAAKLAQPSKVMPVPGYRLGSCQGEPGKNRENVWALCVFDEPPLATLITRRDLDFWRRETWDASVQAETQQRRIRLLGSMSQWNPACRSHRTLEECAFHMIDGQNFTIRTEAAPTRNGVNDDDERRFEGIAGAFGSVFALLAAVFVTWMLSFFISRRLLGTNLRKDLHRGAAPATGHHGVLFYSRRIPIEEIDRLLLALRSGGSGQTAGVTRINLAAKAFHTELAPDRVIEGRVLLSNLDIALVDATRRRDVLDALERLVDNPRVQLLILCRRSPIEQLYHPERYPEAGPQHALAVEESLRWDNVLQKFECRDLENMDVPRTHPHLATVDHHRTWKLCSRTERLLLYELARGRLANPRNTTVIEALLSRGLLTLDPWPKIADQSFEKFVRTAETTDEVAQWQEANQDTGKRWRSTVMAILLGVLLLAVLWFSWSAGEKFKVVYAILAGAVAFLSQIGQAFNFVRAGAGTRSGG
jgi:hypothetical protein